MSEIRESARGGFHITKLVDQVGTGLDATATGKEKAQDGKTAESVTDVF